MEILTTLLASIMSGGATGLLGVALQRYADYKNAQLQMQLEKQRGETEIAKRQIDKQITESEYAGKLKVAQSEGDTAKDVAETGAFGSSLLHEPDRYSNAGTLSVGQQWIMVLLDAIRGAVRPLLTVYLCALTTYVWLQVAAVLGQQQVQLAAALEVWKLVVQQILYLTTTTTLWWFGTRNKQEQPQLRFPAK